MFTMRVLLILGLITSNHYCLPASASESEATAKQKAESYSTSSSSDEEDIKITMINELDSDFQYRIRPLGDRWIKGSIGPNETKTIDTVAAGEYQVFLYKRVGSDCGAGCNYRVYSMDIEKAPLKVIIDHENLKKWYTGLYK